MTPRPGGEWSSFDVYDKALDVLHVALRAGPRDDSIDAVRDVVDRLDPAALRRVLTCLAVEVVHDLSGGRRRGHLEQWVERMRVRVALEAPPAEGVDR